VHVYLAIQSIQQEGAFSLQLLCEIAGVPRSSYYKWRSHKPSLRELENQQLTQSMSRVGRCIDNGPMEAFWGTLKCERYYLHTYSTFEELEKDIEEYIHFYNNGRLQAKLDGLSPMEFRIKAA
jgi:transposase InsO family protein